MKDKNISRYTRDTLPRGKTDFEKLQNMSEEEVERGARLDKENPPWTQKMLNDAVLCMPQKKIVIHISLDKDIIDFFKLDGRGYQTRINSVLKSYVTKNNQKNH